MVLTKRQEEILKLRSRGLSQTTVSKLLGTTRENVALIERRVKGKAKRCLESLVSYLKAVSAVTVTLDRGSSVREAAKLVVGEADKAGVKLRVTSTELMELIRTLGLAMDYGTTRRRLHVFVGYDGDVIVLIGELPLPPGQK